MVVIPARIAVNQADGVTNVITAVNVLKPSVIVVTVALIVLPFVQIVTKNVLTVQMPISVVDVTDALTVSVVKIYSAVTVKHATNVLIMFVLAVTDAHLVQLFAPNVASIAIIVMIISAEVVIPVRIVVKVTVGATTVITAVIVLKQFAIAETAVQIVQRYAPDVQRNVATVPVIYAPTVATANPASVTTAGATTATFAEIV